jgi:predicted site-specific integrase-resolvase
MLTKEEAAAHLGIHESTLIRWVEHGIVMRHAYNGYAYLYEPVSTNLPAKHSSRWDRLVDRVAAIEIARASKSSQPTERGAV